MGKREYKTKQEYRYSSSVSLNGPAYGFVLGGPVRDFGLYGRTYALFGESPETIFSYWRSRVASTREYGDSNERTLHFDTKEDDRIHYTCSFKRERLYCFSETKYMSHKEYRLRDRTMPNYALSNSNADDALRKWKIEHPYVDNPEKWINEIENEIQLRSQKINAVVVKKAYNKWEKERYAEKKIRSEWEVIAPDDKKIKCICEWGSQKTYDDGDILHQCYISQKYELIE